MKKSAIILLIAMLAILAGCGGAASEPTPAATQDPEAVFLDPNAVKADYGEYGFASGGFTFGIYDPIDGVLAGIGEPNGTFEAESCAYQGSDFFYYYSGFELTANDIGSERVVTYINIIDDTVATPQGVKIGMAEADMLSAMGTEQETSGLYKFGHGSAVLQILVKDGAVTAIEYYPAGETGD